MFKKKSQKKSQKCSENVQSLKHKACGSWLVSKTRTATEAAFFVPLITGLHPDLLHRALVALAASANLDGHAEYRRAAGVLLLLALVLIVTEAGALCTSITLAPGLLAPLLLLLLVPLPEHLFLG